MDTYIEHKFLDSLKRSIMGKMTQIRDQKITPADSKIGVLLNKVKVLDLALYEELLEKYKSIISEKDSDEDLTNKMIAIILNCDETIEEILFKLISNENLVQELEKFNLTTKLLKQLDLHYQKFYKVFL